MITWNFDITATDVEQKIARVTAVRTDTSASSINIVSVGSGDLSTPQSQVNVLNILWTKYQRQIERKTAVDNFIGDLEATAKANFEARE